MNEFPKQYVKPFFLFFTSLLKLSDCCWDENAKIKLIMTIKLNRSEIPRTGANAEIAALSSTLTLKKCSVNCNDKQV